MDTRAAKCRVIALWWRDQANAMDNEVDFLQSKFVYHAPLHIDMLQSSRPRVLDKNRTGVARDY
jgi:hypothetical protein